MLMDTHLPPSSPPLPPQPFLLPPPSLPLPRLFLPPPPPSSLPLAPPFAAAPAVRGGCPYHNTCTSLVVKGD